MATAAKMTRRAKPAAKKAPPKIGYVHENPLVAPDARFEFWGYGYSRITAGPTAESAISRAGGKGFTLAEAAQ